MTHWKEVMSGMVGMLKRYRGRPVPDEYDDVIARATGLVQEIACPVYEGEIPWVKNVPEMRL